MSNAAQVKPMNRWIELSLYGLFASFMTLCLLFSAHVLYQTYFNSPPVNITSLDGKLDRVFCPGDRFDIRNHIQVTKPIFLYAYVSVMTADRSQNINDTQDSYKPRPHPIRSEFDQTLPWKVPELPPGDYQREVTYRGYIDSENPVYVSTPFTVKEPEECLK